MIKRWSAETARAMTLAFLVFDAKKMGENRIEESRVESEALEFALTKVAALSAACNGSG